MHADVRGAHLCPSNIVRCRRHVKKSPAVTHKEAFLFQNIQVLQVFLFFFNDTCTQKTHSAVQSGSARNQRKHADTGLARAQKRCCFQLGLLENTDKTTQINLKHQQLILPHRYLVFLHLLMNTIWISFSRRAALRCARFQGPVPEQVMCVCVGGGS